MTHEDVSGSIDGLYGRGVQTPGQEATKAGDDGLHRTNVVANRDDYAHEQNDGHRLKPYHLLRDIAAVQLTLPILISCVVGTELFNSSVCRAWIRVSTDSFSNLVCCFNLEIIIACVLYVEFSFAFFESCNPLFE